MSTTALPARRKIDVAAYHRMAETGILLPDERVELIDGDVVEMVPIGSDHGGTTGRLMRRLVRQLDDAKALVTTSSPLRIDRFNEPQPDILVLRPTADEYRSAHPSPADVLLLIEVAKSSLDYDRGFKSRLYARAGVAELWIVDLVGRAIEVCRRPQPEGYGERTPHWTGVLHAERLPSLALDVADIFA